MPRKKKMFDSCSKKERCLLLDQRAMAEKTTRLNRKDFRPDHSHCVGRYFLNMGLNMTFEHTENDIFFLAA